MPSPCTIPCDCGAKGCARANTFENAGKMRQDCLMKLRAKLGDYWDITVGSRRGAGTLASVLLNLKATQLSASPSKAMASEEARVIMKKFKTSLMVAILVAGLSTGAFAQKSGNDNRPPKEQPTV